MNSSTCMAPSHRTDQVAAEKQSAKKVSCKMVQQPTDHNHPRRITRSDPRNIGLLSRFQDSSGFA